MTEDTETSWPQAGGYVLKGITLLMIAALVASIFAPYVPDDEQWAVIDEEEISAVWNEDTGRVDITFEVNKRENCDRVIVRKTLEPIENNEVIPRPIELSGLLDRKLTRASQGHNVPISDSAIPSAKLESGDYMLTMVFTCITDLKPSEADVTLRTPGVITRSLLPIRTVVVVSSNESRNVGRLRALHQDGFP